MRIYTLLRLPSGLLATRIALRGSLEVNRAKVVIDTGAIYTVLHPKFLERIGAIASGTIPVRTLERTLNLPVFTVKRLSVFVRPSPSTLSWRTLQPHSLLESTESGVLTYYSL